MPVIVGLCLAPVGALVATFIYLVFTIAEYVGSVELTTLLSVAIEIIPFGLLYGCIFFIPIVLIVLPVAHLILRRYERLSVVALVATGLVASILLMWGIIVLDQLNGNNVPFSSWRTLNFTFIGGMTGAIVGLAFAFSTRWWRPFEWPGYWTTMWAGTDQERTSGSRLQPGGGARR
jgi:hypothetical protein